MSKKREKIISIIPVSPFEPLSVIKNSIDSLKNLESPEGYELEFYYVIDTEDIDKDERVDYFEDLGENLNCMVRQPGEGKRAGAINDLMETIEAPEYIALFDVDSRPCSNFFKTSVDLFEEDVFMVTSKREIINPDKNFITAMVDAEYGFLSDVQNFFDYSSSFNHFNGLIGLLDGTYLKEMGLNTEMMCEDTDFSERAYMDEKRILLNHESEIEEQAVTSMDDLYNQKVRWMNGAWEGLENYTISMLRSKASSKVKLTWLATMILPIFSAIFSPFSPLYGLRLLFSSEKPESILKSVAGLFAMSWLISYCSLVSGVKRISGRKIKWTASRREDI